MRTARAGQLTLFVDGMNVIGSRPDGWWRDRPGAIRRTVTALERWVAARGEEVVAFFDGRPVEVDARSVDVRFAQGGPNAADDAIVAALRAAEEPRAITVVTSDAGLAARVRDAGGDVTAARGFRAALDA